MSTTTHCPACGSDVEPGFDVCWKCGAPVDGGPPLPPAMDADAAAAHEVQLAHWAAEARRARAAGQAIFQMDLPLATTRGAAMPMVGAQATSTAPHPWPHVLQAVEAEGWHLEHVGYVYRITGSDSRDKLLMTGQQEAFSGEIVGIYLFRAS